MKVEAQKVTQKTYLYITNPGDVCGSPRFAFYDQSAMDEHGWLLVGSTDIELDIPAMDTAPGAIELLSAEKSRILAGAQVKAGAIDDRIHSLLAIGCDEVDA